MTARHDRVVIVGSGPAGYTAAIYAARAMLQPLLIEGIQPGGQLTTTTDVENYPGFADVIQGPWLMEQMRAQALHVGAEIVQDHISSVDLSRRPLILNGDSGAVYHAAALIICTGAQARWLGIPSEQAFRGYGVTACATCDGFFFKGKDVIVVGGGNAAVEDALFLTRFARQVTIVHRRASFRAEKILQNRLFANPKIKVVWNATLDEVVGTQSPKSVTGARLRDTVSGEITEVEADGVFIAIGHEPATALFKNQIEMTPAGYIATAAKSTATNIAGVFAAGDVADDTYRQAVTAAGMGCMAALDAERFLASLESVKQAAE
jgi:thioredoxin reductase (NADPH)